MSLRLDWCLYEAAKFAVERWHYPRRMPVSKIAKSGAWEDNRFGLEVTQVCEPTRVVLGPHRSPTSRIVAIAVRMLKRAMLGLRLIVSYADTEQGHIGTLYQVGGWIYIGLSRGQMAYIVGGRRLHKRTLSSAAKAIDARSLSEIDPDWQVYRTSDKHCYVYPLDEDMRRQVEPLRKPYPKRDLCVRSVGSGTPVDQPGGALQCDPDA